MQGLTTYQFRTARYLSVGVLAASSFLYSQSIPPSAAAPSAAGQPAPNSNGPNSNGGWKRVGDSSVQVQTAQSEPVEQAPAYPPNDPNQGPPPPAGQGPYAQQPNPGGSAPQQSYGQQPGYGQQSGQQPMYQPPPVPASLTIPAGTFFTVRTNQLLSTDKNQTGDAFSATLVQPVVVNGVVVAEPGQTLAGRVAESVKAGHVEGTARLGIQLTELTLVDGQQLPIQSALVSRKGSTSVGRDAGAIAGTTGLGAAIGAAAGWGTGAAIGAGAGAAAGVIGVLVTRGHPSVIYPEQLLTFRIDVPLTVSTVRAPQAFRYIQPNEYDRPMESQQAPYDGPGPYASAGAYPAPAPAYYGAYGYPNYGYGWGYGYPYYSGFSLFLGGGYYGRGFYGGRGYYGGRGFYGGGRGFYGGGRGFYGGGRGYVGRGGGGRR